MHLMDWALNLLKPIEFEHPELIEILQIRQCSSRFGGYDLEYTDQHY